ncbi:MAG: alpha/beta fold hydrolase [Acidobacteriota bacterium]
MTLSTADEGAVEATFQPPWWLRNAHLQTIWGRATRSRRLIPFQRESLTTADGDELVVDHMEGASSGPRFLLLHGLEGSSYSVYIQGMLSQIRRRHLPATVINFRHCARDPKNVNRVLPNRRPRMYHSGETTDFDFVVRTMREREAARPLVAIGSSLGGNVLLKWLGENGPKSSIVAAATLSVPYDLSAGSHYLEETAMGRVYSASFMRTLRRKAIWVTKKFESQTTLDPAQIARTRTMIEFDDAATAPLHGFTSAEDYYARSSSIRFVERIAVPTLCISALDDPFLPPKVLPLVHSLASAHVEFLVTERGGHVGFVGGVFPWQSRYWAEEYAVDWVLKRASDEPREMLPGRTRSRSTSP